ncbi:MAG: twin-arginine translocation pathway signal protein [Rhodospirillaceae bacterium]|jgi:hypothetical protein|nr:twin-arginine translocation pathway signal protein [Rhodospirillaceae bacterium]MBT6117412.1 twin-arginine translocation pathway signal protein [Rhodospirillaceae bacterium]
MPLSRRAFIRIAGGGTVLAAAGLSLATCDGMPEEAVAPWRGPGADEADPRRAALARAILAPNPHNIQPWLVDLTEPGVATLFVDRERLLPETDPFGRQILIGHGCFLELASIAAAQGGHRMEIDLFPEGAYGTEGIDERPVARIRFIADPGVAKDPLFAAIPLRRSTKEPYTDRPLAPDHAEALRRAHRSAAAALALATEAAHVARIRAVATEAMRIEMETPRTLLESLKLTRIGADEIARHRDGIDLHGPFFWWAKRLGLMSIEEAATPGTQAHQAGLDYALGYFAGTHGFGWLTTADNTRESQVEAGRAYARLNLAATLLGVAMHPVSQALQEYPEVDVARRSMLAETATLPGHTVQMLFRLGYADRPDPSPRRPLGAILGT